MSGLFGSVTVKGNRLTDMVGQTSAVGRPIPFGYGYCKIDEPNVIWTAGIPKEHVKKKKQGKGGVKTEEYSYTLSYAIAFMAGPVYGFLTIIRGGKVVYTTDPNATVADKAFALKWRQKARFYYGTRTQMPDSTIESYVGAGRVSAFRDLCYIVVVDDDVTAEGGAVPQYEAVIIATPPDVYLTSKPYPNDMAPEAVQTAMIMGVGELRPIVIEQSFAEGFEQSMDLGAGEFKTPIIPYYIPPELVDTNLDLGAGRLFNPLITYNIPPESLNCGPMDLGTGWLRVALVNYERYPPESLNTSMVLGTGTLEN